MRKLFIFLLVFTVSLFSWSQTGQQNQKYPNKTLYGLQDKNFYLFTAIADDKKVTDVLESDKIFKAYWDAKHSDVHEPFPKDVMTVIEPFLWSEEEIRSMGEHLVELSKKNPEFVDLVQKLRKSNRYANFGSYPDDEFLYRSWELCAKGLDTILNVYGAGRKPLYPKIDSVSFDANSRRYLYAVSMLGQQALKDSEGGKLFFRPSLNLALSLLYANHKDEAVRYDPLEEKENAKAVEAIGKMDFNNYDYASIVVLGGGPESYREKLSIGGKINLQLAINEYRAQKAPFIIVSGGHVHPYMTPYCEALEMKEELMEEYGIPEERIIIEPYARHTTTNMRNATRLMTSYGIPMDKKSLVVTNPAHSAYVGGEGFRERCQNELGYQPIDLYGRLSTSTLEFTGNLVSLHQNPYQPLDP